MRFFLVFWFSFLVGFCLLIWVFLCLEFLGGFLVLFGLVFGFFVMQKGCVCLSLPSFA